uniref:Predicted protein n=1 Tax=Hordeum vulgare subsp. vulgare TaxID=112509 RepID=F2D450_HORVV|nr:predicted protein [Hordeum vulgare subsp. vulgare]
MCANHIRAKRCCTCIGTAVLPYSHGTPDLDHLDDSSRKTSTVALVPVRDEDVGSQMTSPTCAFDPT